MTAQMDGAVDCHAHVFIQGLTLAAERRYQPDYDAPVPAYLAMLDSLGLSHGLLIQPSFLGTDNSFLLAALRMAPDRLRGVVVLSPDCPVEEMREMAAAGIVGVRLNLMGRADPPLGSGLWRAHLSAVAALGWHVEVQAKADRLSALLPRLLDHGGNVVVDHFGLPDGTDAGFGALLDAAGTGRTWVKLSAAYRSTPSGWQALPTLLRAFGPERLVWGSDWPHTGFEKDVVTADQLTALNQVVADAKIRRQILFESPRRLFRLS